jgi:hypothetical protein
MPTVFFPWKPNGGAQRRGGCVPRPLQRLVSRHLIEQVLNEL